MRRGARVTVVAALLGAASMVLASCGTSPAPVVASITPATGPARGGTSVRIDGSNLSGITEVRFGSTEVPFTVVSSVEVMTVAPPGHGAVLLTVADSSKSVHAAFAYVTAPRITSISTRYGSARGGTRLVVHGAGFSSTTLLLIGSRPAHVLSEDPTVLVATTPRGFGSVQVRAVGAGGVSATSARTSFHYRAKVLVVGDSLGIDLGWGFTSAPGRGGVLHVTDDAVGSTGLVRTDYYDWPRAVRNELVKLHPDVVVALFGANDEQPIATSHGVAQLGTAAWDAAYEQRIRALASVVESHGATLLWVGLPRMSPTADLAGTFVATVDRLGQAAMAGRHFAAFVSTSKLFTTPAGRYTPYVHLSAHLVENGRQPDGVHLTPAGATAIDQLVELELQRIG